MILTFNIRCRGVCYCCLISTITKCIVYNLRVCVWISWSGNTSQWNFTLICLVAIYKYILHSSNHQIKIGRLRGIDNRIKIWAIPAYSCDSYCMLRSKRSYCFIHINIEVISTIKWIYIALRCPSTIYIGVGGIIGKSWVNWICKCCGTKFMIARRAMFAINCVLIYIC